LRGAIHFIEVWLAIFTLSAQYQQLMCHLARCFRLAVLDIQKISLGFDGMRFALFLK
jgi:hypothetical protein